MTASETTIPTFARGDLVTVTYDDGTQIRTWHGAWDGLADVHLLDRGAFFGERQWQPVFVDSGSGLPDVEPWLRLGRPYNTVYNLDGQGLPSQSRDWSFQPTGDRMSLRVTLPGVSVTAITDEGRAVLAAAESVDGRRERLIEAFRVFSAEQAVELDGVIEELVHDAYSRGQQDASGY